MTLTILGGGWFLVVLMVEVVECRGWCARKRDGGWAQIEPDHGPDGLNRGGRFFL